MKEQNNPLVPNYSQSQYETDEEELAMETEWIIKKNKKA